MAWIPFEYGPRLLGHGYGWPVCGIHVASLLLYNHEPFTWSLLPDTGHIHVVPVGDVHLLTSADAVPRTVLGCHKQNVALSYEVLAARPFTSVVGQSAHHDSGEHVTATTVAEVKSAAYLIVAVPTIGDPPQIGLLANNESVLAPSVAIVPSKYQYPCAVPCT